jgi:hypothetical protein
MGLISAIEIHAYRILTEYNRMARTNTSWNFPVLTIYWNFFILLSLFWEIKCGLWDRLSVCASLCASVTSFCWLCFPFLNFWSLWITLLFCLCVTQLFLGLWKSLSYFTTDSQSVSQYVLVSSPFGLLIRYYFLSESCCLVSKGHPLWREDGSAVSVQSLNGPSHAEHVTIFYCLIWDSPNLEGQVPVFISTRNRVAQLYPRALGSLYIASCDSQGYSGGTLTRLNRIRLVRFVICLLPVLPGCRYQATSRLRPSPL